MKHKKLKLKGRRSSRLLRVGGSRLSAWERNLLVFDGLHATICLSEALWREHVYSFNKKKGSYVITSSFGKIQTCSLHHTAHLELSTHAIDLSAHIHMDMRLVGSTRVGGQISGDEGVASLACLRHVSSPTSHLWDRSLATPGRLGILKETDLCLTKRGSDNITSSYFYW